MRLFGNDELLEECLQTFTTRSDGRTVDLAGADGEVIATTFVPAGDENVVLEGFEAVFQDLAQPISDRSSISSVVDEVQQEESPLMTWKYIEEPMSNLEIANQRLQSEAKTVKEPSNMKRIGSIDPISPATFKPKALPKASAMDSPSIPPVLPLNQVTFGPNVLQSQGAAGTFMVLFCYSWWEPCQQFSPVFEQMGSAWQNKLNKASIFSQEVRFAKVDCALERVLCNEQGVEGLPHVQRYSRGIPTAKWIGSSKNREASLAKWLDKQLGGGMTMQSTTGSQKTELPLYYALLIVLVTPALACVCVAL